MSDVKWIKLSTQMFEDEKIRLIESMPEADTILIVWVKLLSQAGRANNNGYIYLSENIPYTDEMLSTIFNRPLSTVRMALEVFRTFGMIDIDENQFISISNWEKHQNVVGLDKIREQTKKRVEKHRQSKKKLASPPKNKPDEGSNVTGNATVTLDNATELELDLELELEKEVVVVDKSAGKAFRFYEQNISHLVPHIAERISIMIDESSEELVHEALKRSVEGNARNKMNFADTILKSWSDQLITTLAGVEAADKEFERRKRGNSNGTTSKHHAGSTDEDWDGLSL
ncbi:DnaD domain protein [Planococcus sp. ANT_H30]|uniref:phage replisome organizer N-terminal domain-containing protein n=1 Tax=Planococcus sp. ANT_H30 TaxID=2597347 RepID=UPI0011ECCDF7|nr:phage replisome organizer N-terminal domain-containing protein [Planococcus sp. ANT_H30]KAA0956662.1 DnaD domain protein [Planococcus sp. ANT_H30]